MELSGSVALITGAARRVGRAIALALADEGARVVIHYGGSAQAAEETVADIRARGSQAVAVQADLADPESTLRIIPAARAAFGRVDMLVNNASIFEPASLAETTAELWDRHFDVNLKAPFLLTQTLAAQLAADGATGKIVNIVDWRALRPGADHFAYTITKSALVAMTQSTALALAPRIQVNCVALGAILLPAGADEDYRAQLIADIPTARMGSPEEVAQTIVFLMRHGDFITGETILLDGGRHLV
ncbi:MAG: SDR family oxidoreductase [Anaerolineales bacterium]